jgi:hypothetical protein
MEEGSEAPIDGFGAPRDRLRAALDASCVVGTWEWDIAGGTMVYDTGAAELLTGDAALADTRISSLQAVAAVHPDDHPWLLDHVQQSGGLVLAEYRVVAQDGAVRWLLSRGRSFQDPFGRPVRASGIIIDITEMHEGGERPVVGSGAAPLDPLSRAADLAIALKRTLDTDAAAEIHDAVDRLLMCLGRAIARESGLH